MFLADKIFVFLRAYLTFGEAIGVCFFYFLLLFYYHVSLCAGLHFTWLSRSLFFSLLPQEKPPDTRDSRLKGKEEESTMRNLKWKESGREWEMQKSYIRKLYDNNRWRMLQYVYDRLEPIIHSQLAVITPYELESRTSLAFCWPARMYVHRHSYKKLGSYRTISRSFLRLFKNTWCSAGHWNLHEMRCHDIRGASKPHGESGNPDPVLRLEISWFCLNIQCQSAFFICFLVFPLQTSS